MSMLGALHRHHLCIDFRAGFPCYIRCLWHLTPKRFDDASYQMDRCSHFVSVHIVSLHGRGGSSRQHYVNKNCTGGCPGEKKAR